MVKKIFFVILITVTFFIMLPHENSPEGAYENFCEAIETQDVEMLVLSMTGLPERETYNVAVGLILAYHESPKEEKYFEEVLEVHQNGESATLNLEKGIRIPCKKVDDKWKIDLSFLQEYLP